MKSTCLEILGLGVELVLLDFVYYLADQEGESEHQLELVRRENHCEANRNNVVSEAQEILLLPLLAKIRLTLY